MTREELIKAIYDNEDTLSCPEYACDMPEKEGNTGECCLKCAEKQLKAYEDRVREDVIDECIDELREEHESWVNHGRSEYALATRFCIEDLEQLKENNNG